MEVEGLTLYNQNGGYKAMGWDIKNSILSGGGTNYVVPAALLYVNNNFDCKSCNQVQKGVVNSDLFDRLYSFLDNSVSKKKNKTKKLKKKRKNKTRKY